MDYIYLFFSALISATLFPFGSEAILLYDLTINLNVYLLFLFATIGNTLGSIINYWLGLKGETYLVEKNIINEKKILKAQNYFNKYGAYSLLFSWLPIIGDPITFIAGVVKYDFKKFVLLVLIAKAGRYLFVIGSYYLYLTS
ncbi:MAG: DedA family protein [Campylobacteraceae bacterium]|jgi:membrane protein YqaA with SNARE-associated domain|nr:DedA family protein [Campylobacteraceae bacterium]MBT3882831.1 DedA family protein [Campylobacteraceae bacterium]MBT4029908.1 DedA family protein [Campylobacteraceae bacterium]MBT4572539.1 DedA family protein [Campylobacteraceae bacterium]MBT4707571.1 DedA family protein [Campylobacteraceae bacterium]